MNGGSISWRLRRVRPRIVRSALLTLTVLSAGLALLGATPLPSAGAITSTPSRFVPLSPTRVLDTRAAVGVKTTSRPGANATVTLTLAGTNGVPANATAVVLNVTLTQAAAAGFVQVMPTGQATVGASSNLNADHAGQTLANLAVVPLGNGGQVSLYTQSGAHLVADLLGYFVPSGATTAGRYLPLGAPSRVLDTRGRARPGDAGTYRVPATASAGGILPNSASAVVATITMTNPSAAGFVQVIPTGGATKLGASSSVNAENPGQTIANLVVVPVGADGSITLYAQRATDVLVDFAGYFTSSAAASSSDGLFVPVTPLRVVDTRDKNNTPIPGPLARLGSVTVSPLGRGGLPVSGVSALAMNLTLARSLAPGYAQVYPTGQAAPGSSSTLNVDRAGQTQPAAAFAALSGNEQFTVYAYSGGDVVADVAGYFSGPNVPSGAGLWHPDLNTSWQWMIEHALNTSNAKDMGLVKPDGSALPASIAPPTVYDIDGEYNSAATVAQLHAMGKRVICYVDVGVYENYRPDASQFPASVIGAVDAGWNGSYWLDIRRTDILLPIMRNRLQTCKDKGFDAIEPDEIDGYSNNSGFPLTYDDQLAYNRAIADIAHSIGISIGLKGDIDQVKDLWQSFEWTLNEQCYQYNECDPLSTYFLANGKAVFQVEYSSDPASFCPKANAANFNSMLMPLNLNGGRQPCR
jgi:hypothetical protein